MSSELLAVRLERPLMEEEAARLRNFLPEERRLRLARVLRPEKQAQVLCAYGLLNRVLRERYGWRKLPVMALELQGKPYFPEYPSVQFSLSHTDGAAIAGVSDEPIGVDIEKYRRVSARLRERLAPGATGERFFQDWVRRESFAKRTGRGIADLMESDAPQEGAFALLQTFPGYFAGAACTDAAPDMARLCSLEELVEFLR